MRVTFQDPELKQTIVLDCDDETLIRDAAQALTSALRLSSPPLLYALLQPEAAKGLASTTLVDGDRVVLPDDMDIPSVLAQLRDPGLPIYFQTIEIDPAKLFELRTLRFRQLGNEVAKLQEASVLVGGVGLLGSEIAMNLAVLGVGKLYVVDRGSVDWLNLYRQPLFTRADVYQRKVDVVRARLEDMAGISVQALPLEVPSWRGGLDAHDTSANLHALDEAVARCELVIGTFDTFSARAALQFICLARQRPYLVAALEPGFGEVSLFTRPAVTGCYCCGTPDPAEGIWYDGGACTLARLEAQRILTAAATRLALDLLEGREVAANSIVYNAESMTLQAHRRAGSPRCSLCGSSGAARQCQGDVAGSLTTWLFPHQSDPTDRSPAPSCG